jgi:hypothetical protein
MIPPRLLLMLPPLLFAVSGCAVIGERLANGAIAEPSGEVVEPNGVVIEPNGAAIGPDGTPVAQRDEAIQTVITGLSEAQQVRLLTRQLAR